MMLGSRARLPLVVSILPTQSAPAELFHGIRLQGPGTGIGCACNAGLAHPNPTAAAFDAGPPAPHIPSEEAIARNMHGPDESRGSKAGLRR